MKKKDLDRIEQRLLHERDRVQEVLGRTDELARISTEDDGELTTNSQHMADHGTDTMEQEKTMALLDQESEQLANIDDALRRLYAEPEKFGICGSCGADIEMERLDLVPWTQHCATCQRAQESAAV